jgi:hypothetical protein
LDKKELIKAEAELIQALNGIRFMLGKPVIPVSDLSADTNAGEAFSLNRLLDVLGDCFTSSEFYQAYGKLDPKASRGAMKNQLTAMENVGSVKIVDRGLGRRPSTYQKIT